MGPIRQRAVLSRQVRFGRAELVPEPARPTAWRLLVDGVLQSYVDLADPLHLELRYVGWIAAALDHHWPAGNPVSALLLGGGGFTLPRYLAATRPGSSQVVYEPDGALVEFVREQLALDELAGLRVRVADGAEGIAGAPEDSADLVVVDVYAGGAGEARLSTVESLGEVSTLLRQDGLYLANVWDHAGLGFALRAVASTAAVFRHVLVIAQDTVLMRRQHGNVVIVGSQRPLPAARLAERIELAETGDQQALCLTPKQLAATCGHAEPLRATDPEANTAPTVTDWRG